MTMHLDMFQIQQNTYFHNNSYMIDGTKKKHIHFQKKKQIPQYNLMALIPIDSYEEVFSTLAVENYDLFCIKKYTTIINREKQVCVPACVFLKQHNFFFNSVKTLHVSTSRSISPINFFISGTLKSKSPFYFLGLKLGLNFSSLCLVHFASCRCFYL